MKKSIKIGLLIAASGIALYGSYKAYKAFKQIKQDLETQKLNEALEEAREVSESIQTKEVIELNGEEKEVSEFEAEQDYKKVNGLPYFEMQPDGLYHEFQVVDGIVQETPDSIAAFYDDSADKAFEDEELEAPYFVDENGNVYLDREELGQMRYPANSPEAVEQYKNFITADLEKNSRERTLVRALFDYTYVPTREFDENAVNEMVARRIDFFGDDRDDIPTNPSDVTVGEVLIYYAEKLNWDYDWSIQSIVNKFMNVVDHYVTNDMTDLSLVAEAINSNTLITDDYVGIFMLEKEYQSRYLDDDSFGLWSQMQNINEDLWSQMRNTDEEMRSQMQNIYENL